MSIEDINEKYLINDNSASALYKNHAQKIPFAIHCGFMSSADIASLRERTNITECLFGTDDERIKKRYSSLIRKIISSSAFKTNSTHGMSDYELFRCLCTALPSLTASDIYDCIRLCISKIANDPSLPSIDNCNMLWQKSRDRILEGDVDIAKLLSDFAVKTVFSKEDPAFPPSIDMLKRASEKLSISTIPEFCPDGLFSCEALNSKYISSLSSATETDINNIESLKEAYRRSLDCICFLGCKTAVHNIYSDDFFAVNPNKNIVDDFFCLPNSKLRSIENKIKAAVFRTEMIRFFSSEYAKRKMVMRIRITEKRSYENIFDFKFDDSFELDFSKIPHNVTNDIPIKTKIFSANRILDIIKEKNDAPEIVIDLSDLTPFEQPSINQIEYNTNYPTSEILVSVKPNENVYSSSSPSLSEFMPYNGYMRHIEPICDDINILSLTSHDRYRRALCRSASEYFSLRPNSSLCAENVINYLCGDTH